MDPMTGTTAPIESQTQLTGLPKELIYQIGPFLDADSVKNLRESDLRVGVNGQRSALRDPAVTQHLALTPSQEAFDTWLRPAGGFAGGDEAVQWLKRETVNLPEYTRLDQLRTLIEMGLLNEVKHLGLPNQNRQWNLQGNQLLVRERLELLLRLPHLENIDLPSCLIVGSDLSRLASSTQVKALDLSVNYFNDADLMHLPHLPNLRTLNLEVSSIRGSCLPHIRSRCPVLEHLNLEACPELNAEAAEHLAEFSLKTLSLVGCQILGQQSLRSIGRIKRLENLNLAYTITDNQAFLWLSGLSNLKELSVRGIAGLGRIGIQHLGALPSLQHLDLSHSDGLQDRDIEPITHFPKLKRLDLRQCRLLTREGIEALQRPGLEILHSLEG